MNAVHAAEGADLEVDDQRVQTHWQVHDGPDLHAQHGMDGRLGQFAVFLSQLFLSRF